jgi:nucleotide-binding universal stress UspA family protein
VRPSGAVSEFRRVLVPTDLSPLSLEAVPFAYALAAPGGCVYLLHVVEPSERPNPLYAHYRPGRTPTPAERAAQEDELREQLRGLEPEGAQAKGVSTEVEIAESAEVAECIAEAAERLHADAICMSSHGRSGLRRAVFGSVAEAVLCQRHRPILIVPGRRS